MTVNIRLAQPIVWTQALPGGTLRDVRGYAFTSGLPAGQVRDVRGYAFSSVQSAPPKALTGPLALLGLINQNTVKTFVSADLSFGAPVAQTGGAQNTKVNVVANNSSGYAHNVDVFYNRIPIQNALPITPNTLPFSIPTDTTIVALLPQINTGYGVNLAASDIVDAPVKAGTPFFNLVMSATGYLYSPGSQTVIGPLVDLATVTPQTFLNGFDNAAGVGPVFQSPTVLLMHFNGANGQTTTTDDYGHTATMSGGAQLTNTQAKFGNTSLQVIANGAQCVIPDAPELRLNGDYTIEFFSYINAFGGDTVFLSKGGRAFIELLGGSLQMALDGSTSGTNVLNNGAGLVALQWQHIAMVKKASTYYFFINGNLIGTTTSTGTFGNTATPVSIGGVQGAANINAYIDELRISRIARYTASFAPPTAPFTVDPVLAPLSANFAASPSFFTPIASATTILNSLAVINGSALNPLLPEDLIDGPIAAGATSITLTAAITSRSYVVGTQVTLTVRATSLLLHFEGANGATTTTDDVGHQVTLVSNTLTTAVKKFGASSMQGNASGVGYAQIPFAPEHQMPGDFTLECFWTPVTADVASGNESMLFASGGGSYLDYFNNAWFVSLGGPNIHLFNGVAPAVAVGTTYHVALTRAGTTVTLWLNGVSIATASSSLTWGDGFSPLRIGNYQSPVIGVKGSIDEVRVTKGVARYTAAFTPPQQALTLDGSGLTLAQAFAAGTNAPVMPIASGATTVRGLVNKIALTYGVNLVPADLVDGPVASVTGPTTLTAASTSLTYVPGSQVTVHLDVIKTVLLLHFDGVAGATTFVDAAGHPFTVGSGTPKLSGSPVKFGGTAFVASGGCITTPAAPELQLASDYTIEFFSNQPSVTGNVFPLWASTSTSTMFGGMFFLGSAISVGTTASSNKIDAPTGTLVAGVWQHIALVQHGTTLTLYVNGVSVATVTGNANQAFGTGAWRIGCSGDGSGAILGSIDEFRVSNIARYTANFTPPTQAFTLD